MIGFLKIFILSILILTNGHANWLTESQLKLEKVVDIKKGVIWGFTFLNKKEILFTVRRGDIYFYNLEKKVLKKLRSLDVFSHGQGGLLDIQNIPSSGRNLIYLTYSKKVKSGATTALAMANWDGSHLKGLSDVFIANSLGTKSVHFGSRLAYDGSHLYMTIGDRGERNLSQDLLHHNGKILKLTMDGKPAMGNPFSKPEIYSYGHRNPQGIFWDEKRKLLFSCEFGPRGGDELNIIERGHNYGWPVITYGREYYGPKIGDTHKQGMRQPVFYWVPSISPSGLAVYSGSMFPEWEGDIFLANLSSTHLRRLKFEKGKIIEQQELYKSIGERVRFVKSGPDGKLYFSTDSGIIYSIKKQKE